MYCGKWHIEIGNNAQEIYAHSATETIGLLQVVCVNNGAYKSKEPNRQYGQSQKLTNAKMSMELFPSEKGKN